MTSGHILSQQDDQTSQDTAAAWEQVDQLQQQFELDMQNMLTPRVTDEDRDDRFQFQNDIFLTPNLPNLDDSINSSASFAGHTQAMVSPIANMKPPNGFPMTSSSSRPPQVKPKPKVPPKLRAQPASAGQVMNGFNPPSLAVNKKRPSVPDLQQLTNSDPKKPQLRKGKVPRAVWVQKTANKAIESSSESESDSDMSADTVIAGPGDTDSLKSSHV